LTAIDVCDIVIKTSMNVNEGRHLMKHLPVDLTTAVAMSRIDDLRCQADRYRLSARIRRTGHHGRPPAPPRPQQTEN